MINHNDADDQYHHMYSTIWHLYCCEDEEDDEVHVKY